MPKHKLQRFNEMDTFANVFQPSLNEISTNEYKQKGKWSELYFKNNNPITLELGCGKGEYTIELSQMYKDTNFIGVDIKGARMWRGAKTAIESNFYNVAFLRTRVEFINYIFAPEEINEIWITFPDPQLKKQRIKKRLTSHIYLNLYSRIINKNGLIHLKTDNDTLYNYTLDLVKYNNLQIVSCTNDLYNSDIKNDILNIKTFYEKKFLAENKNINYIAFKLPAGIKILPNNDYTEE